MKFHRHVLAALLTLPTLLTYAAPRITTDRDSVNFGRVPPGSTVTNIIKITNAGDEPLVINDARGNCGCTAVELANKNLKPGESVILKALIDMRGRSGAQNKVVFIRSNDPAKPTHIVQLNGSVADTYDLRPSTITAGRIRGAVTTEFSTVLQNFAPTELRVTNVTATTPQLQVTSTVLTNGRSIRITARTVAPLPQGDFKARILIETDAPGAPRLEVPIEALVSDSPVIVTPPQPIIASLAGTTSRQILIAPGTISDFKILSVKVPDPSISSHIPPPPPGGPRRVMLIFKKATTNLNGRLVTLTTDIPEMPEIQVPITVNP